MGESTHRQSPPPRLAEETRELGALLGRAEAEFRANVNESGAWERLQPRIEIKPARRRPAQLLAVALAATAVALLVGWGAMRSGAPTASRSAASAVPPRPSFSSDMALALTPGSTLLPDGTRVVIERGSHVRYRRSGVKTGLELKRGRVELSVAHQAPGSRFSVDCPTHELRVLGTRFVTVVDDQDRIELSVSEGRVGVYARGALVTIVEAGGRWSSPGGRAEPQATEPSAVPASNASNGAKSIATSRLPPDQAECQDHVAKGYAQAAEQCYLAIANVGRSLSAEMAWYEVARLRRDVLGNPAGALAALDEHQRRFGGGSLSPEVQMSRVDLLARLGRVDEALAASERLLSTSIGRARQCELRLLRGNLLRDRLNQCARAELEYRTCESDPGGWGDRAQLARAGCLEKLGRTGEAIASYQAYLSRPRPLAADRARQRLEALQP